MDHIVNMHEAKSQLSKLVALAQKGEAVTIAIHGKPAVRLTPVRPVPVFGLGRDQCPPVPWSAFASTTRKPIDPAELHAVTSQMPEQSEDAGAFVRAMRDADRY